MTKIVYDLIIKITLTYGSITGTGVIIAGLVYLFLTRDGASSIGIVTVGAGLVIGRSALEKIKMGDVGGGSKTLKPITKPSEEK